METYVSETGNRQVPAPGVKTDYAVLSCRCSHTLADHWMATQMPCHAEGCQCQRFERVFLPAEVAR